MKTARIMEILSLTPASMLVTCRLGDHVKLYKITDIQKCTINNEECVVLVIASNTSALTADLRSYLTAPQIFLYWCTIHYLSNVHFRTLDLWCWLSVVP